ncbi:MAG: class I SAM-dependent methyltransferase [Verrucomicrobiaceae bacterium]
MGLFGKVTAREERDFERENVRGKRDAYLATNPLDRFEEDAVYRAKVERVRGGICGPGGEVPEGWVLDLGGNTGGEATVLRQQGVAMVVSDINELALSVSKERAEKFGLVLPGYVAADVHRLPFADGSFATVAVIEALHHFEDYDQALGEIFRVLRPGGVFYTLEPNGWNPIRRLSEVRDRFRGTIEKSFFPSVLRGMLERAGFESVEVVSVEGGRSEGRMGDVPAYRRFFARFHSWLQRDFPKYFGALEARGVKPGEAVDGKVMDWEDLLRVPGGGAVLRKDDGAGVWRSEDGDFVFPDLNGVPVLVEDDRL